MRRLHEFGCHLMVAKHPVGEVLRYARLLDSLGFDHLKVGDHTLTPQVGAEYPNSQALLSTIGAITKRIRISTAVTDPFRRHPAEIAQWIATEDRLTGGRVALGIGAGEKMNLEPFGIKYERPVRRLREAVEVIKLLWQASAEHPVSYHGDIFTLAEAYLQFSPFQKPRPPIYVGALGTKTRELAGEVADGWVTTLSEPPSMLRTHLADVRRGAKKAGKKMEELEIVGAVYTEVTDDRESALRRMEPVVRSGLVMERDALKRYAEIDVPDELTIHGLVLGDEASRKLERVAASIPQELVERMTEETTALGSADECIGKIERFLDAGATTMVICNVSRSQEKSFRAYAKTIIPYLKSEYGE